VITDQDVELAARFCIINTPSGIDGDSFGDMSYLLAVAREENPELPIELRVCGYGGGFNETFGIVELIRADGNVDGVAFGIIMSAHVAIWAACARRWLSVTAGIGIHRVALTYDNGNSTNFSEASSVVKRLAIMDSLYAETLSGASTGSKEWWLQIMNEAGNELSVIERPALLAMEMARPYEEYGVSDPSAGVEFTPAPFVMTDEQFQRWLRNNVAESKSARLG
jgi:ATP-dependent protease ClpP protease subunit